MKMKFEITESMKAKYSEIKKAEETKGYDARKKAYKDAEVKTAKLEKDIEAETEK